MLNQLIKYVILAIQMQMELLNSQLLLMGHLVLYLAIFYLAPLVLTLEQPIRSAQAVSQIGVESL